VNLGRLVIDVGPLRSSRDFRLLYIGRFVSLLGTALTMLAVSWQLYELTHSSLLVGVNSLATSLATVLGLLKGGVLADRVDRRRVLLATRVPQTAIAGLLAANSLTSEPRLWVIMTLCAAIGLLGGLGGPASSAAVPMLVNRSQLTAAAALIGTATQLGAIIGPALAGALIAGPGVTACFVIDAISFGVFSILLGFLRPMPPSGPRRQTGDLAALRDGFRFVRHNPVVSGVLLIDANAMVFGMPESLFPALATQHFHGDASTFGLMATAPAVGAVLAAISSGWTSRVARPGRVVIGASIVWGAAIVGFGLAADLAVALLFLAVAGAGDVISEVLRSALLQHCTPDDVRGRVTSVWLAQTTAAPGLGNAEAGAAANLVGLTGSVVSGGLICVVGAVVIASLLPSLRHAELPRGPAPEFETAERPGDPPGDGALSPARAGPPPSSPPPTRR
jgi:ENTS family enterobactin (siderophore) exporter